MCFFHCCCCFISAFLKEMQKVYRSRWGTKWEECSGVEVQKLQSEYIVWKNLFSIKGSKNNEHTTECAWYVSIAVIRRWPQRICREKGIFHIANYSPLLTEVTEGIYEGSWRQDCSKAIEEHFLPTWTPWLAQATFIYNLVLPAQGWHHL